jgi:hypothetical protein
MHFAIYHWHKSCIQSRPLNIVQSVQFFAWSLIFRYVTGAALRSHTFPTFWFLDQSNV